MRAAWNAFYCIQLVSVYLMVCSILYTSPWLQNLQSRGLPNMLTKPSNWRDLKNYWMTTSSIEQSHHESRCVSVFPFENRGQYPIFVASVCQFPTTCKANAPGCPANSSSLNVITALFRRQLNKPISGQSEVMKKMKTLSHVWRYTTHLGI